MEIYLENPARTVTVTVTVNYRCRIVCKVNSTLRTCGLKVGDLLRLGSQYLFNFRYSLEVCLVTKLARPVLLLLC